MVVAFFKNSVILFGFYVCMYVCIYVCLYAYVHVCVLANVCVRVGTFLISNF